MSLKKIYRKFSIKTSDSCYIISKVFDSIDEINDFYDYYIKDNRNGKIIGEFDDTPQNQ